jgi:hypothetical protein
MQGDYGKSGGGKGPGGSAPTSSSDSRIIDALARGGMTAGDGADDGDGEAARITRAESNGMFRRIDRDGDGYFRGGRRDLAVAGVYRGSGCGGGATPG